MKQKVAAGIIAAGLTIATALAVKWEPAPGDAMLVAIKPVPTDPWTICYGHTKDVHEGMTATREQCEAWLHADIQEAASAVLRCINAPMTGGQLGAFTDAVLNLGPKVVCGSTLQRKANAGDMRGACTELTHAMNSDGQRRGWSFAGGRFYQGLRNRRFDERAACWPGIPDFRNVVGGVIRVDLSNATGGVLFP